MRFSYRQPKDRCGTMVSVEILTILTMVVSSGGAGSKGALVLLALHTHTHFLGSIHKNHRQDSQEISAKPCYTRFVAADDGRKFRFHRQP